MTQKPGSADTDAVVVGCDGSPQSMAAVEWATLEAARRGASLTILLANPLQYTGMGSPAGLSSGVVARPAMEDPGRVLEQARLLATKHLADGAVVTSVAERSPTSALLAASADAGLVVVGSRGHGALGSALLGSVSTAVAEHAACPVVVVRGTLPDEDHPRVVIVGVDGSPESAAAVSFAARAAAGREVPLLVLCAWTVMPILSWGQVEESPGAIRQRGEHQEAAARQAADMAGAVAAEQHPGLAVRTRITQEPPAVALAEASRGSDLVVLGAHHHSVLDRALLGSVSRTLLHHSSCPVAVVR